ncbi:hypothetical protein LCGC14_1411670 [marine sediment metagenome]|uniref:Uncharacterized protein n=1 Tax=marine sediment metagenome TaxID=412755 RepID=A0A0F9MVT5_9ZZZZ
MKRIALLIAVLFVLMATACFPRTYNVQPNQTAIFTDPETLEQILQSDCFQSMSWTIKVEGVTVEKKLEAVVDVAP